MEEEQFIDLWKNNWPPPITAIHGIFRRLTNWNTFKDDLPSRGKWVRLDSNKYQPAPKTKDPKNDLLDLFKSVVNNETPEKSNSCMVNFFRQGKYTFSPQF